MASPAVALDLAGLNRDDQRLLQNILEYELTNVPRELPGAGLAVVIVRTETVDRVCRTFRYGAGGEIDSATACRIGNRQWAIDGAAPVVVADIREEFGEPTTLGYDEAEADSGETAIAAAAPPPPPMIPPAGERPVLVAQSEPIPDRVPEPATAAEAPAADDADGATVELAMAPPISPPIPPHRPSDVIMLASAATFLAGSGEPRPRPRGLIDVIPPRTDVPAMPTDRPDGLMVAAIEPTPQISTPLSEPTAPVSATQAQAAFAMEPLVTEILAQPAIVIRPQPDHDSTLVASVDVPLVPVESGAGDTPVLPSPNRGIWPPQIAWEVPMPSLAGAPVSLDSPLARIVIDDQSAELVLPGPLPEDVGIIPVPLPRP